MSPTQSTDAVDSDDAKPTATPAMSAKAAGKQRQKFAWEEQAEAGPDAATGTKIDQDKDRTDARANQPSPPGCRRQNPLV